MLGRLIRVLVVACAVSSAGLLAGPATVAGAAPAGQNCAQPGQDYKPIPWPQRVLTPERVWPFSRGNQMIVAVLASGVDANQPQLRGRVLAGFDAAAGNGPASDDCVGIGTQVAGVIAGQPANSTGFAGLAPGVSILPVRVFAASLFGASLVDPATLAKGINWAVDHQADIIDVPVPAYTSSPELSAAVANALARDVVVVAAAGDLGEQNGTIPTPYPASYPGVVGVGAVDQSGARWPGSQVGNYVDLMAPGAAVVTLQRDHGMTQVDGTGVASGFVAASAALVRAHGGPQMTAATVVRQLNATATPAPESPKGTQYGAGTVNPYAAVTEQILQGTPGPLPALPSRSSAQAQAWAHSRALAAIGAGIGILAVLTVLIVALALPRGRRRFWRSAVAAPPPDRPESEPGPPLMLFDEPQRQH